MTAAELEVEVDAGCAVEDAVDVVPFDDAVDAVDEGVTAVSVTATRLRSECISLD
jgi:hypothetical protein